MKQKNNLGSIYRECQECKYRFRIPCTTQSVEALFEYYKIFCPRCDSTNIGQINKEQYEHE